MGRITFKADTEILDNGDDSVIEWGGDTELATGFRHVAVQVRDLRAALLADILPQ